MLSAARHSLLPFTLKSMASLRTRLGRQITVHTETVEHDGETFILSGLPSPAAMLDMTPDTLSESVAKLWNVKFCPKDSEGRSVSPQPKIFDAGAVGQIKIVLRYAQPIPGEEPYTEFDIAEIYATDALLFVKLFGAAMKCASASNPVEIAAGNSSAEEPAT